MHEVRLVEERARSFQFHLSNQAIMSTFKNSKVAKATSVFVSVMTAVMMLGSTALPASAATIEELQAQINALLAQLQSLSGSTSTGATAGFTFTRNLKMGDTGTDVMNLQKVLNSNAATQVSVSGAGAPGSETSYFGPATKAAVIKFQNLYKAEILTPLGLTSGTGVVGAATRAKLQAMSGTGATGSTGSTGSTGTTPTPTPSTGSGLSVAAGSQPANNLAPTAAARVPFTRFTLTASNDGDIVVNGVVVERMGLADDAVFAGVVLLDQDGIQLDVAKTFNSDHRATIGGTFTVPKGTTKTYTIAGNMASSLATKAGQVAVLALVGINTSASVSGSLPITGAQNTINASLSLGTATLLLASQDPNTANTKEIGTTAYNFAGIRLTAGSAEKVRLLSIRWNQSGSASKNDLSNIQTYVDGVGYPTVVSSDGKYYTTLFGSGGILIDKGFSKDITVKGDITGTGAANRTVKFDIYKNTDFYLVGDNFGYGITPTASGNIASSATTGSEFLTSDGTSSGTPSTPFFDSSTITISAGSVTTVSKAAEVPAQNIAVNVPNQVIGGYVVDLKGEAISVASTIFTVSTTTGNGGASLLTNVTILDESGRVVAGPVDATDGTSGDGNQTLTFTDTITYPIGRHVYTLKGKVPTNAANGETYIAKTTPSSQWSTVQGQISGNTISLSALSTQVVMNTMTVKAAALDVRASTDPTSQTIVAGGVSRLLVNFQFDGTQSGEDVRFSTLPLTLTVGTSNMEAQVSSCQAFDGTTALNTGSNVVNGVAGTATYTLTLDNSYVVPKGSIKTLALKCNLSSSASGTFVWKITGTSITATGVTSGSSVSTTGSLSNGTGPTMTIGGGSLTVSADASAPSYTVAAGGATGITAGVLKFRASNQAINLEKVGLKLTNDTIASSSSSDLVKVSLWDGLTKVGEATFTGTNLVATSTFASTLLLPKDSDKVLTIKLDLAQVGTSQTGTSGHLIKVDLNSTDTTGTEGTGVESGTKINLATSGSSGSTTFAGIRLFKSFPTFALETLPQNGVSDGRLMRFKVTANANGPLGIQKFTVGFATSSATVTSVNIFAYQDSAYSQGVSTVSTGGQMMASNVAPDSTGQVEILAQTSAAGVTLVQVPAGGSIYFEVRGTVGIVGGATSYSVTTTLKGDSAYPSLGNNGTTAIFMASTTVVELDTNDNLIWSPFSTTTLNGNATDNDYTNGFGLPGFPQNGLIQTRNN
ncbi:MAG: peptidoglycan-binding protein [Patescibacteria group bacterium]